MNKDMKEQKAPMSRYAGKEIRDIRQFGMFCLILFISISWIPILISGMSLGFSDKLTFGVLILLDLIAAVLILVGETPWIKKIKRFNQLDYARARQIREVFNQISRQEPQVAETDYLNPAGSWRPVKAMVLTGQEARLTMRGCLELFGSIFTGFFTGTFEGQIEGSSQPMLDDLPATFWLENEKGEIMRLIAPSKHMMLQMFAAFLKRHLPNLNQYSHVWNLLEAQPNPALLKIVEWLMPDRKIVDQLLIACDKPLEQKPLVKVKGKQWGTGVFVSAISINEGSEQIIFASASGQRLISGVDNVLGVSEKALLPAA